MMPDIQRRGAASENPSSVVHILQANIRVHNNATTHKLMERMMRERRERDREEREEREKRTFSRHGLANMIFQYIWHCCYQGSRDLKRLVIRKLTRLCWVTVFTWHQMCPYLHFERSSASWKTRSEIQKEKSLFEMTSTSETLAQTDCLGAWVLLWLPVHYPRSSICKKYLMSAINDDISAHHPMGRCPCTVLDNWNCQLTREFPQALMNRTVWGR